MSSCKQCKSANCATVGSLNEVIREEMECKNTAYQFIAIMGLMTEFSSFRKRDSCTTPNYLEDKISHV